MNLASLTFVEWKNTGDPDLLKEQESLSQTLI